MDIDTGLMVRIAAGEPVPANVLEIPDQVHQDIEDNTLKRLGQVDVPAPLRRWASRRKRANREHTRRENENKKKRKRKRKEAKRSRKRNRA